MTVNRQITLAQRPVGLPGPACWALQEGEVPEPGAGQALVRVLMVGVEPAMRGWINEGDSYVPAVRIGEVMRALGVGEVVASNTDQLPVGTLVSGMTGWQEYVVADPRGPFGMRPLPPGADPADALGVFGTTGLTAYFGLLDVGKPEAGQTVLVSGAAGATGSVVGQIAKIVGCRVVGTAGGPEKCEWVRSLGFDECVDYKAGDVRADLRAACPDGVDVYFDNVGGEVLEAALDLVNERARVVLCGGISTYNATEPPPGPRNYMNLVIKRARMEGFIVIDYAPRFGEAVQQLAGWMAEGRLQSRSTVVEGLERAPEALNMLFTGANTGKLVVAVA
jgi:NADPH-dependent curcumin reductase CurA